MKRFLVTTTAVCISFALIGCGSEDTSEKMSFEIFEQGLTDNGISFEKEEKLASMVGAVEGYGYSTDIDYVEVYKYDTKSDAYSYAKKNNVISFGDWGDLPAIINGELALYNDDTNQVIIDIFTNN